jgi:hypothetical protein
MTNTEVQQMMLDIIKEAQSSKPMEFHLISNWTEYKFYKSKRKTFKLIIKALQSSTNRLLKNYCRAIVLDIADITKLLAYHQMQQTISFFQHEHATISDMLYEYNVYLSTGNFMWAFLGGQRSEADMQDFRK